MKTAEPQAPPTAAPEAESGCKVKALLSELEGNRILFAAAPL
jgi:hypothetical protein